MTAVWDDQARAFARELASLLQLEDEDEFESSTSLFDDWALDSLQAFAMILVIEAMAGIDVPSPDLPDLYTVGDAYGYFRSLRASAGGLGV